MICLSPNSRRLVRNFLWLVLPLALAVAFPAKSAAAQAAQPSPQPDSATASANQTAAAQAAARKKRFEEDEKRLENGEGSRDDSSSTGSTDKQPTLFVSPAIVGMLVNERQQFTVFDIAGHNLTAKAHWSLSGSSVAEFVEGSGPAIIAKADGTATLRASIGGESSEAQIKVYPGDKLPIGTIRWAAPKMPGYTTKQIVQAVPTSR